MGRKKRRAPFGACAAFRDCIPEGNKGQEKRYGIRVEACVGPDTVKLCGRERESAAGGFFAPGSAVRDIPTGTTCFGALLRAERTDGKPVNPGCFNNLGWQATVGIWN